LTSRIPRRPNSPSFPYTTLFRSRDRHDGTRGRRGRGADSRDRRGARRVNGTDAAWVVGRLTIGTLVRVFGRLRVYGRDRVPKTGGCVYACNHFHWFDPAALGAASPRTVYFMAKMEAHRIPGVGQLIRFFGTFPVRRGESD